MKILNKIVSFVIIVWVMAAGSLAFSLIAAPGQAAANNADLVQDCKHGFLGLKPWYQYLGTELNDGTPKSDSDEDKAEAKASKCEVKCFNLVTMDEPNDCGRTSTDVPLVMLAIVDDLLRIAGLTAVGFVFVGAFRYVGSQGNPDSTSKAQETIINALIGLVLAMTAVAIVSFLGSKLGT